MDAKPPGFGHGLARIVSVRSWATVMVSTIKEGIGSTKSDYLWNHAFKSPVTRTDTRS
jgi:hypothetical protein|eukprot:COSAG06_NODE_763_length_12486_cov_37.835244_9_plen_58_part_00